MHPLALTAARVARPTPPRTRQVVGLAASMPLAHALEAGAGPAPEAAPVAAAKAADAASPAKADEKARTSWLCCCGGGDPPAPRADKPSKRPASPVKV